MLEKVFATIEKDRMLKEGESVIVGVSGGADSVALLLALNELRDKLKLTLFVVHVNHNIRGLEAVSDAEFVASLCKKIQVDYKIKEYNVPQLSKQWGMSEEEAGRKVRYDAFEEALKEQKANKIAVAHNLNDQAETVIMRLCRGTGMTGLRGIGAVRDNIIRPLIECTREEIEEWLKKKDTEFRTDFTNLETIYTRNKIRLKIVPVLKEINSKAVENIAKTSELISQEDQFIENEAQKELQKILAKQTENQVYLKAAEFLQLDMVLQRRIIRQSFRMLTKNNQDLHFSHIEDVLEVAKNQSGKKVVLSHDFIAEKEYGYLKIQKGASVTTDGFSYELKEDLPLFVPEANLWVEISQKAELCKKNVDFLYTKCFDCDRINDIIKVRSREKTDSISIGKKGGTKKLKDFFIDEKVPRHLRDKVPVIACKNQVLWIIGYRSGAVFEADEKTEKKLWVRVWEANND